MRHFVTALIVAINASCAVADETADLVMGNWEGQWRTDSGDVGGLTAKTAALGGTDYKTVFGLEIDGEKYTFPLQVQGKPDGSAMRFGGEIDLGSALGGSYGWKGTIADGKFAGTFRGGQESGTFNMERITRQPPNVGLKPPAGAVVLFDGTSLDGWTQTNGQPAHWKLLDGAMQVDRPMRNGKPLKGSIISKSKFTDHKLHVEFRTPFMPTARGQSRGNSGVYVQGHFEVQVLDSFAEPPRDNEAGGIYKVSVPKVNACLPPGEWQAYDITLRAIRFDDSGKLVKPGMITVVYNGVTIHDGVELTKPTPGGIRGNPGEPGPLLLQDHGNPVQYRNIWALPLSAE